MKKWDINNGMASTVSFVVLKDTTELNDNPVSQAEHGLEADKIPLTSCSVSYTHFITRGNGTDIISRHINYGGTSGVTGLISHLTERMEFMRRRVKDTGLAAVKDLLTVSKSSCWLSIG